ncbi:unnamed protein product [Adineta ricciae]|uniref:Histone deacetylase complex subunit SAP130 C-terminal domain-containing protein n=2 Tax=Adineta ricciae TaxID=249248 RepID=A0A814GZQ0_ADIRI|nr:unnamed protein product [Adineta ricciae]
MTVRVCSHRRSSLPMQSDVLNEQQQQLSTDIDCSSSISTTTATTLIYSGLKLHPKPLVPTISMPGVASPLSIVKKLSLPDSHLDNSTNNVRHTSSSNSTTTTSTTTPSSIRLVTPTGKSSSPTNLSFQLTDKSTTNGGFSTSKTYILNPQQSSTTTVKKQQIPSNSTPTSSLVTLIPPGTTSPKIQTLNTVTIASTNDIASDRSSSNNSSQPVYLSKNRVTRVQPLITNSTSSSSVASSTTVTNNITPKLVIQPSTNSSNTTNSFWQPHQQTQATKIFSIPPSSILPTAKVLSRPVQLIPTSISSSEHHHHHPHITHVQSVKSEKNETFPISMHFGLSSPTTAENPLAPLNVQVQHPHSYLAKNLDSSGHQTYFHMQLLPSSSNTESINSSQQSLQFTLPATHLYSSSTSTSSSSPSVLISTTQRSMDHNNNHQSTTATITTPIIREMQIDEKSSDSNIIKNFHHNKMSTKNRTRLPLQPSAQQITPTTTSLLPSSSSSTSSPASSSSTITTTIRQPKKHKLIDDDQLSSGEPPSKLPHCEQFDSSSNLKKLSNTRCRPLSKFSIENTTPTSSMSFDASGISKKRHSAETANAAMLSKKRRTIAKLTPDSVSNENVKQEATSADIIIDQIDDELLRRLSQDFVYVDKRTGIRWIGTKTRPKSMSTLVSRFSWKPKINHYEKYSDIIRTNPKRTVPVKSIDTIQKRLTEPWASWRIDRLTTYLADLTQDEQITQNQLSDITQLLDTEDETIRTTIDDLIQANLQRHRCFCEQLTQISNVLVNLLDHGNTLRDICSMSRSSTTKRTKER